MPDETLSPDRRLPIAREALRALLACQAQLDGLAADVASAHLDAAIHALREEFALHDSAAAEA